MYGVNRVVMIIYEHVCANRSLFEIVVLVHVIEEDKIISERSCVAYIHVQGERVDGTISHECGATHSGMLVLSNGSEKIILTFKRRSADSFI
jgi:hypothetical protein